jgi:dipeptidase
VCTTLLVGRNRSATGRVLLAHSEELGRNSAHRVDVVEAREPRAGERFPLHSGGALPQPPRTARYLCTRIFDKRHYPGDHTSGINEHGVAAVNNMATMRGIAEARMFDLVPGGVIWTEFLQLALERAATAREAVALVGGLCESHGLSCDSGTMIALADPDEGWWVEMARGGHWAACRVDDDEVSVRANCYRIPSFAAEWGDEVNQSDRYNLDRHEALDERIRGAARLAVPDLAALLRDVYEGTPLHATRPDGSPFGTSRRTIARLNTEAATILEPRRGLPPALAQRMWCSLSTSLTGTFVPFHLGLTRIEPHYATAGRHYDAASAYWLFTELARIVDYRYHACAGLVRETWTAFEAETLAAVAELERRCERLDPAAAARELTDFDLARAGDAVRVLERLLDEVKTRAYYEDH